MVELPHLRCPGCGKHLGPVKARNIPLAEKFEDCLRRCERCRIGATNAKNPAKVRFIQGEKPPEAPKPEVPQQEAAKPEPAPQEPPQEPPQP
ncbi:MAG: hypothetical protein A2X32_01415 [Elusimicrobia bacterium GWC2_64_44]|nr:MAG: hypothetical protein A2X32_01415 [Elusimicrobia bacterium GWC2_64_44]